MATPEGQLQALKHRLADAERELSRAEPEQEARIREDMTELDRQIAQQQKVIDNPKAAQQQVQQSIEVGLEGERQPAIVRRLGADSRCQGRLQSWAGGYV